MNLPSLLFPRDLLKLLVWVFFKPLSLSLERYLRQIDPRCSVQTSIFTLLRKSWRQSKLRHLLLLTFFDILVTPGLLTAILLAIPALGGINVDQSGVKVSVVWGLIFGLLGGMEWGVWGSMICGIGLGVSLGVFGGVVDIMFTNGGGGIILLMFGVFVGVAWTAAWGASGRVK
jgi:hypothetical protein